MKKLSKYKYNQNWNIGFTNDTVNSFMANKKLGRIEWMKHTYKDRFFADPFILDVKEDLIIVMAEELLFKEVKGKIVKLIIDRQSKELVERSLVLELDTHLSYPFILKENEDIYICPENSKSGILGLYKYDKKTSSAAFIKPLIKEPLVDATIYNKEKELYIFATKSPLSQEALFLYTSKSTDLLNSNFEHSPANPIVLGKEHTRPAGNIINYNNSIYRPAQNSTNHYGEGIVIREIEYNTYNSYSEKTIFYLYPNSFKYNLGLHTINFHNNTCVIDGCGYLYPIIGRILNVARFIKKKIFKSKNN